MVYENRPTKKNMMIFDIYQPVYGVERKSPKKIEQLKNPSKICFLSFLGGACKFVYTHMYCVYIYIDYRYNMMFEILAVGLVHSSNPSQDDLFSSSLWGIRLEYLLRI